jgi:hypothetical protein
MYFSHVYSKSAGWTCRQLILASQAASKGSAPTWLQLHCHATDVVAVLCFRCTLTLSLSLGQFQVPVRTVDRLSCTIKVEVKQQTKPTTSAATAAAANISPKSTASTTAAAPVATAAASIPASASPAAVSTPASTASLRKKTDKQLQGTKQAVAKHSADDSKS